MAKDKQIICTIPAEFNKELIVYLEDLRGFGINKNKADLIIDLARLGFKIEKKEIEITNQK